MKRGQLEKPRRMRSHLGCFHPGWARSLESREFDNLYPGRFQNCYGLVLCVIEWEHLLWFSCPFSIIVCLVGMEESGEVGKENSSQLFRSRGAASTYIDHEILNCEPDAFMG